jgi:hypothetical protein
MYEKLNPNNTAVSSFVFVLKKTGGFAGVNQKYHYNSYTRELISYVGNTFKVTVLPETDEDNIKQIINDNNIFATSNNYPPNENTMDYFSYGLLVMMNGNSHIVEWTDPSNSAPEGLQRLSRAIENIPTAQ